MTPTTIRTLFFLLVAVALAGCDDATLDPFMDGGPTSGPDGTVVETDATVPPGEDGGPTCVPMGCAGRCGIVDDCGTSIDCGMCSCDDDACSGHGVCMRTTSGTAYCECDDGYYAEGLTCVEGERCLPTVELAGALAAGDQPWQQLAVDGDRAYVGRRDLTGDRDLEVTVIDLSDPSTPSAVGRFTGCNGDRDQAGGLAVKDGYVFVGCDGPAPLVEVWDARSGPASASLVTTIEGLGADRLELRGNYLFGLGRRVASTADVSDPASPRVGAKISDGPVWESAGVDFGDNTHYCTDIAFEGDLAWLACGYGTNGGSDLFRGVIAVDIADPMNPSFVSRYYTGTPNPSLVAPAGANVIAFSFTAPERNFLTRDQTLTVLNSADPSSTFVLDLDNRSLDWGARYGDASFCSTMETDGGFAFLGCTGRLWVGPLSTSTSDMTVMSTACVNDTEVSSFKALAFSGSRMIALGGGAPGSGCPDGGLIQGDGSLLIYDLTRCP